MDKAILIEVIHERNQLPLCWLFYSIAPEWATAPILMLKVHMGHESHLIKFCILSIPLFGGQVISHQLPDKLVWVTSNWRLRTLVNTLKYFLGKRVSIQKKRPRLRTHWTQNEKAECVALLPNAKKKVASQTATVWKHGSTL